jgi:hypothetical protein
VALEPAAAVPSPAPPAPVAEPSVAPDEGPICQSHPYLPARKCRQCSAFYCARCLPEDAQATLCASCNTAGLVREAPEKLRGLFQQLWLSPLIMGVAILLVVLFLGGARGSESGLFLGGVFGTFAGSPFFVMALIIALTRSTTAAWFGFALELLALVVLALTGGLCIAVVALIVPFMTVSQIRKIEALQALLRAHGPVK